MTAVPGGSGTALLICDQCGDQDNAGDPSQDSDLVWPAVTSLGWSGSAFATGTHLCPRCSISQPSAPPPPPRVASPPTFSPSYDIRSRPDIDVVIVTPLADLDAGVAELLRDELMRAAARGHIVVDLHTVRFIDSAALGLLVRAHQETKHHGGRLILAAPSRFVLTVLHTMRLDGTLASYPDVPSAVAAISGEPNPRSGPNRRLRPGPAGGAGSVDE